MLHTNDRQLDNAAIDNYDVDYLIIDCESIGMML